MSTESLNSFNPSDGSLVWQGSVTPTDRIENIISEVRSELSDWAMKPPEERILVSQNFKQVLEANSEKLASLISREIGKPLWEARTEVSAMVGKVDISIKAMKERCGELTSGPATTRFKPHGLLVVLGPYNFPGHLPNGHLCPALLAGNAVIFKPSELAPATGELLVQLWHEAGVPESVLQIVQGQVETAIHLTGSKQVDGVLFTGSAGAGKHLAQRMAATPGKILALEMGGNNPLIVDPENLEDVSAAVEITLRSAFLSAGQRCTCARRLIVIENSHSEAFISRLISEVKGIRVGDPFADPQPFMGPVASSDFPERILAAQSALLDTGATALLAAHSLKPDTGFISPGVIDVTAVQNLPDEEIFGPVLQLIRVPDLESAVAVANNTRYGLAAGILSDDLSRYHYAYQNLRAGIINWNTQLTGASSAAPFGGIKDSGNLRPSAYFAADYCAYPVASMEADSCRTQPAMPGRS